MSVTVGDVRRLWWKWEQRERYGLGRVQRATFLALGLFTCSPVPDKPYATSGD